jgi:hypothetical protein
MLGFCLQRLAPAPGHRLRVRGMVSCKQHAVTKTPCDLIGYADQLIDAPTF